MKILTWKNEDYIVSFVYLLIKENLYLNSYLSGSKIGKNRNQRVHTGALMCGGAYMRGAYMCSNTSVKEKVGLSAGAYKQRNTVFNVS